MLVKHWCPNNGHFRKLWSLSLTLTYDVVYITKERVLPQGICMWNMKAWSLTIQKLWSMWKFLRKNKWTSGQTDGPKTICPDLSMWGHKKDAGNQHLLTFPQCLSPPIKDKLRIYTLICGIFDLSMIINVSVLMQALSDLDICPVIECFHLL